MNKNTIGTRECRSYGTGSNSAHNGISCLYGDDRLGTIRSNIATYVK